MPLTSWLAVLASVSYSTLARLERENERVCPQESEQSDEESKKTPHTDVAVKQQLQQHPQVAAKSPKKKQSQKQVQIVPPSPEHSATLQQQEQPEKSKSGKTSREQSQQPVEQSGSYGSQSNECS